MNFWNFFFDRSTFFVSEHNFQKNFSAANNSRIVFFLISSFNKSRTKVFIITFKMTDFRRNRFSIKNQFLISYRSIKTKSRLWYELMISFDFCFISSNFVSKLILKIFIVLTENFFWNRFRNAMTDSKMRFFWNSKLTVSTFVFAHSTASSIRKKLMLFIYFFERMTFSFLYELSSCFSFLNHFAVEIIFFSEKHSQKIKIDSKRFMIITFWFWFWFSIVSFRISLIKNEIMFFRKIEFDDRIWNLSLQK